MCCTGKDREGHGRVGVMVAELMASAVELAAMWYRCRAAVM